MSPAGGASFAFRVFLFLLENWMLSQLVLQSARLAFAGAGGRSLAVLVADSAGWMASAASSTESLTVSLVPCISTLVLQDLADIVPSDYQVL